MKPKLSDLWRWDGPLERGSYLFWGMLLAAIKFNLDRFLAAGWFGRGWTIFDQSALGFYLWQSPLKEAEKPYFLSLLAVSLPFLWAGTVLTLRRLRSLGWRPFWVLLFFVPVVKFIFFAVLCILKSREERQTPPVIENSWDRWLSNILPRGTFGSAIMGIVATTVLAVVAAWLGTAVFRDYGWSIFVGLPFCMGFLSALIHSFHEERSLGRCLAVANATVLLVGAGLLLFAMEGMICLVMAAPIAFGIATIGGALGYAVQKTFWWREESANLFCSVVLLLPLAMKLEHAIPPALPLLAVKSSLIVNAPPEQVWRNVVSFSELPPPTEIIFKLGVAYPIRAEISGSGVGAVRHCNFSTGPFVEPIEVWDEPRLLKFSVTQNPEPMQEWTPYRDVHPAHLDGYLESRAGQFRLVPVEGGRTRLEGTTWYHHHLWPAGYWQFWSDQIIRTIHRRVLNHVKQLSERKEP
ncbi:MAG: hypothetical protein HY043_20250 [Verrucomicrobia bacterium]|nr:hypothetical protein [Verrucomicrobiota bacterium]